MANSNMKDTTIASGSNDGAGAGAPTWSEYMRDLMPVASSVKGISLFRAGSDSMDLPLVGNTSYATPTDVLISRWYPGYRTVDLTGPAAEEAIAILLGDSISTLSELAAFQKKLGTPDIAMSAIAKLFARPFVPLKSRETVVSEEAIAAAVAAVFVERGLPSAGGAVPAYTHAITRVLASKGLVLMGETKRLVKVASSFVITIPDLQRLILTESMRTLFSEQRINDACRTLDQNTTPQLMGEVIGNMFRHFSLSIPEIKLRLEQLDMVINLVKVYNLRRDELPTALEAHPSLRSLASLANFIAFSVEQPMDSVLMPTSSLQELKDACNAIDLVVRSAPAIESISLSKFTEFFGEAPSSSAEGTRRGTVIYSARGQTSKMDVANIAPQKVGARVALVDPAYVKPSSVSSVLNGSLLTTDAMTGLASLVADEMSNGLARIESPLFSSPTLAAVQVTDLELTLLAMARAQSVAFVDDVDAQLPANDVLSSRKVSILYGVNVAEQWRSSVFAASPNMAFFTDPASVIVYTSKMLATSPKALPSRSQTIGLSMSRDTLILSDIDSLVDRNVQEIFSLKIPVRDPEGKTVVLNLDIPVLGALMTLPAGSIDKGDNYVAAVREPGVDAELQLMMDIAVAYAALPATDTIGDSARSWLVLRLAPLLTFPQIVQLGHAATNRAIVNAKFDGRRLGSQARELYVRALLGTALAVLNRFGKINNQTVVDLVRHVPVNTLSTAATTVLSQLPDLINGSRK